MKKAFRVVSTVAIAAIAMALILTTFSETVAQSAGGDGVTSWTGIFSLNAAGASYTVTTDLGAVYAADYGSAQIDLTLDVTGSQQVTLVPQFSNQPVACASVTQWFTATDYLAGVVATNTTGYTAVTPSIAVTGDASAGREVTVYGRCMRVRLVPTNVNEVFTPTIYVRLIDRQ